MKKFFLGLILIFIITNIANAEDKMSQADQDLKGLQKATFAGGCFWCIQSVFDKVPGVKSTAIGYTGGSDTTPTYEEVSSGVTGHAEAVEIIFDPKEVSYEHLVDIFWKNIDPTTLNQQFADVGTQYRTAIYYHSEEQKKIAQSSKEKLAKSGMFDKPIVTEISPAKIFYKGEDYHDQYYKKNPMRYKMYEAGSGRKSFVEKKWGAKKQD